MLEEELEEVELSSQRDYDGPVMFQPFSDNDTTTLFQDLERELEKMVQKYRVPPTDLENLFQVRKKDRKNRKKGEKELEKVFQVHIIRKREELKEKRERVRKRGN